MSKTSQLLVAASLAAAMAVAAPASAAPVIYNLTLTATSDTDGTPLSTYNGVGTITLSAAPNAAGLTNYGNAAVTFQINGVNFSGTATSVQFLNGAFYNASFSQEVGKSPNRFDLQTSGSYVFYYANELQSASGRITASAGSASAVPEAASWAMMILGMGAVGFALRRSRTQVRISHAA